MTHEQLIFDYDEELAMQELVAFLVRGRGQFAVSPYPQDLKNAERTGWCVSWPKGQLEIVRNLPVWRPTPPEFPGAA